MSLIDRNMWPEIEIRQAVEFEVGKSFMQEFELWAFRRSPMTYNEGTPFVFLISRSTKYKLPKDNIEAISKIINIWKKSRVNK